MIDLSGQGIVVTGATRGFGRAVAAALMAHGASVVLGGRDAAGLVAVAAELDPGGTRTAVVPGTVADDGVAERLAQTAVQRFGRLDGLVSNAGLVRDRTLLKMTPEEFDEVIAVDLRGVWSCGRHAARAMQDNGGWILNVASSGAFHGSVGQSNYVAAKAGVVGLTRAWSEELQRYGIRVNALCPFVLSEMTRVVADRAVIQHGLDPVVVGDVLGLGAAAAVAELVVVLAGAGAEDLTGQVVGFDGRRLSLWSHPHEAATEQRERWELADLMEALRATGLTRQPMHRPPNGALPN